MRSTTHTDGTSVRYMGTLEAGESSREVNDDAVYVKVSKDMIHQSFVLQSDVLEKVRIDKAAQRKAISRIDPGEVQETVAYR